MRSRLSFYVTTLSGIKRHQTAADKTLNSLSLWSFNKEIKTFSGSADVSDFLKNCILGKKYLLYLITAENVSESLLWAEKTHPETAVHSGDEHDGREDDEAADEEADHHVGAARGKDLGYIHIVSM